MTIKTYTIDRSEIETVERLTIAMASCDGLAESLHDDAPVQPVQIRQLSSGWVGAEWVRYVADYQDSASVGYASLAEISVDHEWTSATMMHFEPAEGPTYTLRYTDGSGVVTDLEAETDEEALDAARDDIKSGDWDLSEGTIWVSGDVYLGDDLVDSVTVALAPEEPECADGHTHDWASPHWLVGGLKENPGVQGNGGGVIYTEACPHCGAQKVTDTWAQNPETGEQGLTSVKYETGVYASAFVARGEAKADDAEIQTEAEAEEHTADWGLLARDAYRERMAERREAASESSAEA